MTFLSMTSAVSVGLDSPPLKAFQVDEEERVDKRTRGKGPPAGAGVGHIPTPDTPPAMPALSPVACVPGHPAVVNHTMLSMRMRFMLLLDDPMHAHIEWLLQTGMIRDIDTYAVCVSLGLEPRETVLSPSDPQLTEITTAPEPVFADAQTSPILPPLPPMILPSLPPMPVPSAPPRSFGQLTLAPSLLPRSWGAPEHYDISSKKGRGCQSPQCRQQGRPSHELPTAAAPRPLEAAPPPPGPNC